MHFPGRIAIDAPEASWTYEELNEATEWLCQHISHLPLPARATACILASRSASLILALLGTIRAGLAFTILDPAFPTERIVRCYRLAQPDCLIKLHQRTLPAELSALNVIVPGSILELPGEKTAILDYLRHLQAPQASHRKAPEVTTPNSLLYIAFTSRSTGSPKAVLGDHAAVTHFLSWQRRRFSLGAADRVSMLSGLGHDPLLRDIFMPLSIGATICVPPPDCHTEPHSLFHWMRERRITVSHLTPSLAVVLLAGLERRVKTRLEALRYVFFGGEPLRYSLLRRFKDIAPNATFVNCYGTTETPQVAAYHIVSHEEIETSKHRLHRADIVPLGQGIDDVELLVQTSEGRTCRVGEHGEICVRSAYLARGVWDENGRPAPVFETRTPASDSDDLTYRTGDTGYYLPHGTVAFAGRKDRQVKVRGHRVQLEEIEQVLASLAGVLFYHIEVEADSGPSLVLYIVPDPGCDLDVLNLRSRLAEELPDYMVPGRIVTVPELPVTANGKVDVQRLRPALSTHLTASPPAEGDELRRLVRLCAGELGLRSLSPDHNLAENGLDSIRSITLCCGIEEEFGVALSAQDLAECGTPRQIAERIASARSSRPGTAPSCSQHPTRAFSTRASRTPDSTPSLSRNDEDAIAGPALLPRHENVLIAARNRILQIVARFAPDVVRVKCHKWRGVSIGRNVSIGYDTIVETAYPWLVKIGDGVNIGMRVTIIAHFRGMAAREKGFHTVAIDELAFIGPGVIILPNVRVGRGAVVTAGSVVNSSIPPLTLAHGNPAVPIATCGRPLSGKTTYSEFLCNLHSIQSQHDLPASSSHPRSVFPR